MTSSYVDHQTVVPPSLIQMTSLAYMRPTYLAPSAWIEHVPFAFWLVESLRPMVTVELGTHWGVSYFSMCQAMAELGEGGRAFAIDTWTGDKHAGEYGPEVYQAVKRHHDQCFSSFSCLIQSTFDAASDQFPNGSIDLLHIDGLHTYEAVHHDFENWLPKMSPRGVVMLHDTNVRDKDFGVFRLFAEIKEKYPTFEFLHGHGLGVVGVGGNQAPALEALFRAHHEAEHGIRRTFSLLGRACLEAQQGALAKQALQKESAQHAAALTEMTEKNFTLHTSLEKLAAEKDRTALSLQQLQASREQQVVELQVLKESQAAQIIELQAQLSVQRVSQERLFDLETLAARQAAQLDDLHVELGISQKKLEELQAEAHEADLLRNEHRRSAEALEREHSRTMDMERRIQELEHALEGKSQDGARQVNEIASVTALLREKEAELATTRESLQREKSRVEAELRRVLAEQTQERQKHAAETASLSVVVKELEKEVDRLRDAKRRECQELNFALLRLVRLPKAWSLIPSKLRVKRQQVLLERTGLFDRTWYLTRYEDVAKAGLNPERHFIRHGAVEGRAPTAWLDR